MLTFRTVSARAIALVIFTVSGSAFAQVGALPTQQSVSSVGADASMGITYLPQTAGIGNDNGLRLGDGAVLHLGLGAEAGYDSNVFFQKDNAVSSPTLRVVPFVELTNAGRGGTVPTAIFYDLSASLLYREYLTDDINAKAQRAFNPTVNANVVFGPGQRLNFTLADTFVRFEDAPFGPSRGNITRNHNFAYAELRFAPGGGRFEGMLRYSNALLLFDNQELKYANNMGHDVTLDLQWRWMPKTSLFIQGSVGYFDYFEAANPAATGALARSNSIHYRGLGGLRGLITQKVSVYLAAGYAGASYDGAGAVNPSGLMNLAAIAELTYAASLRSKVVLGYRRELRNSAILGNFQDVDAAYLSINQSIADRVNVGAFFRYENRSFRPTTRTDDYIQAGLQADIFITPWLYAGALYSATINASNQQALNPGAAGLDYGKHLILARLGVKY